MEIPKRAELLRNVLVLAAVVGLVLLSWLLGHILRYSIPSLWHPPIQETDPELQAGITRLVLLPGLSSGNAPPRVQLPEGPDAQANECVGYTYFTSLPAKCLTEDGRLVEVPGFESNMIVISP